MASWWNSLSSIEQIFGIIAIPATLILIVQIILMLLGVGFGGDADLDIDGDGDIDASEASLGDVADGGLQLFTVKGIVAFFSIFGWSGLALSRGGVHEALSLIIAFVAGVIAMVLIAYAMKIFMKLEDDGTMNVATALGVTGSVYIRIPANRKGTGKVSLIISGRMTECDAVTDETELINTGTSVTVVAITTNNVLVVKSK